MTAYFENGVFANATPAWHGMGITVDDESLTSERIFELVPELASDVVRAPIFAAYGDASDPQIAETESWLANVRTLDGKVLGVQGPRYKVFTGRDLFDFGDAVLGEGVGYETAGTLKGGSVIWALAQLPGEVKIAGLASERMVPYIFFTNSFDGTCTFQSRTAWTRVVCMNTWNMAMHQGVGHSIRHTANMHDRVIEAQEALGLTFDLGREIEELGTQLIGEKMNTRDLTAFLELLVPVTAADLDAAKAERAAAIEKAEAIRFDIAHIFKDSPTTGDAAGTKWGALQAVIEYTQRYQVNGSQEAAMRRTLLSAPELNTRARAILVGA